MLGDQLADEADALFAGGGVADVEAEVDLGEIDVPGDFEALEACVEEVEGDEGDEALACEFGACVEGEAVREEWVEDGGVDRVGDQAEVGPPGGEEGFGHVDSVMGGRHASGSSGLGLRC